MTKLRQLCIAGVFTLVLTTATFGGEIQTPGSPQPPSSNQSSATTAEEFSTSGIQSSRAVSDSVATTALNLLQTMLSMF